jgi:flagellin
MSVRINTNIEALNAQRNLSTTGTAYAKSVEKLSSGMRINRAADDAAGLAISEKLRAQVKGLNQAQRNAQDGISMIQTGEGALNEVHSILQRMRELSVQASNGTYADLSAERTSMGAELLELAGEIDRIAGSTKFNGQSLLTGALSTSVSSAGTINVGTAVGAAVISAVDVSGAAAGATFNITYNSSGATDTLTLQNATTLVSASVVLAANTGPAQTYSFAGLGISLTFTGTDTADNIGAALATAATLKTAAGSGAASLQVGADAAQTLSVTFVNVQTTSIGTGAGNYVSDKVAANSCVDTAAKASALITVVDDAIKNVSSARGGLGAAQNRLEHTITNLGVAAENLTASESRIRDLDVASEMVNFTKLQILQQAGTAILAQANQAPQSILALLR